MIPIFLGHLPAGAATKQLLHYAQLFDSGKFRQYDYGRAENKRRYGTPEPPDYDLSKMTIPTFLHYGLNDLMAVIDDFEILRESINPAALEAAIQIPLPKFNHLDFITAIDVVPLVYDRLLDLMNRF